MQQMQRHWHELVMDVHNVPHMRAYIFNKEHPVFTVADMLTAVQKMNSALSCVIRDHVDWKPE
jgi:hypothetical protein